MSSPKDHSQIAALPFGQIRPAPPAWPPRCPIRSALSPGRHPGQHTSMFSAGSTKFFRFTVKLWRRRGRTGGVTIATRQNLTAMEQDANNASVTYSGLSVLDKRGCDRGAAGEDDRTGRAPMTLCASRPGPDQQHFEGSLRRTSCRTSAQYYIADNNVGVPQVSLSLSSPSWTVRK